MAILRCYEFIQHNTFHIVIERICRQIKGIGDPLVSMYARTYLARKGNEVEPALKNHLHLGYQDFIFHHKVFSAPNFPDKLASYQVTAPEYFNLYSPALDWLLSCIGYNATQNEFNKILESYKETNNSTILRHVINCFDATLISPQADKIIALIEKADGNTPRSKLLISLGSSLVISPPSQEVVMPIFEMVTKLSDQLEDPLESLALSEVFIDYSLQFCTIKEVNIMLESILRRAKEDTASDAVQSALKAIIQKIVNNVSSLVAVFSLDNFSLVLDCVKGSNQVEVCKSILQAFSKTTEVPNDPVVIGTIFTIATTVHDSLNSLSFFDDIRQSSRAIAHFIHKVDYGMDLEKHLNFFVECRKSFANLDYVKQQLVLSTLRLAMRALQIVKGKHTKKTAAFARACISYCFITVPTMEDAMIRLKLYILCGHVALANQSLPQADALFKSAVKLIQEVPPRVTDQQNSLQTKQTEGSLMEIIESLLGLLVAIPGHPEQGPFYLIKGLLKVISDYPFEEHSTAKLRVYVKCLPLLSAQSQVKSPYGFSGVEGNDTLYGTDAAYLTELQQMIDKVVEDILQLVSNLSTAAEEQTKNYPELGKIAIDLFNYLLSFAQLTPKAANLAVKLFNIAKNWPLNNSSTKKYIQNSLDQLSFNPQPLSQELYKKLSS
eukprot:TRINITY_DN4283_c0_g1_i5.p1 TRINITY_DN4283_c0_g1~~TRINITY_DN4283_c0_g1_i5.p1  ORF type:complete len:665 (+),score=249.48 TRINITY_DN4283_c0_g1_i5:119-2113(+)